MDKLTQPIKNFFDGFKKGDKITRCAYFIMGSGAFLRKQFIKGYLYLSAQILFILYMIRFGFSQLSGLTTLGTTLAGEVFDEAQGIYLYSEGHNSMLMLLFGVFCIFVIIGFFAIYFMSVRGAIANQKLIEEGKSLPGFRDELKTLLNERYHVTILALPTILTFAFTIAPLVFMVLIAFTNFDVDHQPPGSLFTWVGLQNFKDLLYNNKIISGTFFALLKWTFIWAIFATFLNYIFGMLLAMLINSKGIKIKKFWRTIFIISIAIPQFVSLLLMSQLLHDQGPVNVLLMNWGVISEPIKFLTNGTLAKITVIVVNLWVGVPYTMLITSGILMNIPEDMYESARIDGAGPVRQFFSITLPYMLSVTTPYLITQFIGNINNFNLIFLLTGGGPLSLDYYQAGKTDLLVTWLYKLTLTEKNYALASTVGIIIFVISAVLSLVVFRKVTAKESDFQ
ncbi:sugar ABC transporter permease [Erysipelothrix inopinata]|uniref:Maltose/maltodextrin transport system permease protein n=1 Tax=Erysipelothrix inopinata TaxID=225084 RepID=A0A7G9RYW6_9FIRM|nr:sugar ABC transporter permease [Erysipelothrix inopinata]QNN60791.1 sugar ABC transporter permease [Erysipelothrix inopinata]